MSTVTIVTSVHLEREQDNTEKFSVMGTPYLPNFPEVLLAQVSPNDWPIVTKHANNDELEVV